MHLLRLEIDGMMCEGCVRRVEKLLVKAGAVEQPQVAIGSATVATDGSDGAVQAALDTLRAAGFPARELG
jgi:copper chaperone CopZ